MKKLIPVILLLMASIFSCTEMKKEKSPVTPIETQKEVEITKVIDSIQILDSIERSAIKKPAKKTTKPGLYFLTDLIGKYPTQEKIFDNKYLAKRLKKIKRFNFDNMKRDWNTENPLTIENQIIHSSGCRAHSCPDSGYELFVDLKNDNINIYFFMGNTLRVYKEKGWITLPKLYQDEIDIKMENAKIGSTSDDLTSKYSINPKKK
ncbi:MAG: hypothetical protein DRJ07_14365 [Bacteroidetes bacterium]|nr:MAG: hypothetical protein DRJ07_14365 [Bacteroidota bacterium]